MPGNILRFHPWYQPLYEFGLDLNTSSFIL
jgi:hypothetical protein